MDTQVMGIEFFKSTAVAQNTDSKSDKNLDHLEDCWARDQILEKKWIHIWYGSCFFHIYTNCTICGVSLLPERRFKVHDALFIWCLEGCH